MAARLKLSDSEFVERARALAVKRSEKVRQRRAGAGLVQIGPWIPITAKQRLDALSAALGQTPADVLTTAIMALPMPTVSSDPTPAPHPLGMTYDPSDRDTQILKLHNEGLTVQSIRERLEADGIKTSNNRALARETIKRALARAGLTPHVDARKLRNSQ